MIEKDWRVPLGENLYIAVQVIRERASVVGFSAVLIKNNECVTRYDCAHEKPHRDILGRKSAFIRKEFCENLSKEEAFEYAIADLKTHARRYVAHYESH